MVGAGALVVITGSDVEAVSSGRLVLEGSVVSGDVLDGDDVDVLSGAVVVGATVDVEVVVELSTGMVEVLVDVVLVLVDVVAPWLLHTWTWLMSYCWFETSSTCPAEAGSNVMWLPPPGPPTLTTANLTVHPAGGCGIVNVLPDRLSTLWS